MLMSEEVKESLLRAASIQPRGKHESASAYLSRITNLHFEDSALTDVVRIFWAYMFRIF